MNKMKEVAQLLGVELEEKFKIKTNEGKVLKDTFVISEIGLKEKPSGNLYSYILIGLLLGDNEIIKSPFKPKYHEYYWHYNQRINEAYEDRWTNHPADYAYFKIGNCFRTKEEAETKGKEIMEALVKEYENEG